MMKPRFLGHHLVLERNVFLVALDSITTHFERPNLEGHQFVCLCAVDARGVPDDVLRQFCSFLIRLGCAYLCTWGPDCERVHDLMDSEVVGDNPPQTYVGCLMTTWHENQSLEDAVDFLLTCTVPDEDYASDNCDSALIISVGSDSWTSEIERNVRAKTIPTPK